MSLITKLVSCGDFVKRQTAESGYSHFEGSWEELEGLIEDRLKLSRERSCHRGYRDGVLIVDLSPFHFRSAIVDLDEKSKLTANFAPRREEEAAFIRVSAKAKKQQAKRASVVLYRYDVLEENNERQTLAEWEVVAIKARVSDEEESMDPYTMARNFLHLKGGTKGDFSAEDFAKSIVYWNNHCMMTSKPKWYRKVSELFRGLFLKIRNAIRLYSESAADNGED